MVWCSLRYWVGPWAATSCTPCVEPGSAGRHRRLGGEGEACPRPIPWRPPHALSPCQCCAAPAALPAAPRRPPCYSPGTHKECPGVMLLADESISSQLASSGLSGYRRAPWVRRSRWPSGPTQVIKALHTCTSWYTNAAVFGGSRSFHMDMTALLLSLLLNLAEDGGGGCPPAGLGVKAGSTIVRGARSRCHGEACPHASLGGWGQPHPPGILALGFGTLGRGGCGHWKGLFVGGGGRVRACDLWCRGGGSSHEKGGPRSQGGVFAQRGHSTNYYPPVKATQQSEINTVPTPTVAWTRP